MVTKEQLRNHWFFRKYEIKEDEPLIDQVWKYQWNHKALIMIECGALYLVMNYLFG